MLNRRKEGLVRKRDDSGFSLIELIVAISLLVALAGGALLAFTHFNKNTRVQGDRTDAWSTVQDANGQLLRDVTDAMRLESADSQELSLLVVRDEKCQRRTYTASPSDGGTLSVTTDFFAQEQCSGPTESRTDVLVKDYESAATFAYFKDTQNQLTAPVQDVRSVTRVDWNLEVLPEGVKNPMKQMSGAVVRTRSEASGTGPSDFVKAPLLTVVTRTQGRVEGVDFPILAWQDTNAAGVVTRWEVLRATNPTGSDAPEDRATWQTIAPDLPVSQLTFTDTTLAWGDTAIYVVRGYSGNGKSETSNQVVTGLAPTEPTGVRAIGQPTSIRLEWTPPSGATGFDIYSDDRLVGRVGKVNTYTYRPGETNWSGSGYGHTHRFRVVATNRWESAAMTGSELGAVPMNAVFNEQHYVPAPGGRGTGRRVVSAEVGAFTAPAAPGLTVTANGSWGYDLRWTAAGWTGSGPTNVAGVGVRDRGWIKARNGSIGAAPDGSWTAFGGETPADTVQVTDGHSQAAVASQYRHYKVNTCNPIGCSPDSAGAGALQRPATPASCTVATADIGTRNVNVTINPASGAVIPNTGYWLSGGVGAPTNQGDHTGNVIRVDQLNHSTNHGFTVRSRNASGANGGYSDNQTCAGATAPLGASTPSLTGRSTRSLSATFGATNGTSRSISIGGNTYGGTSATSDPLYDGTAYSVVGRNTDGWNTVTASATFSTDVLPAPAAPSCSVALGASQAPGSVTVSASGGGTKEVRLNGGTAYTTTSRTWSGLGAGNYTGSARAHNSDGYNSAYSGWASCGTATVRPAPQHWGPNPPSSSDSACTPYLGAGAVMDGLNTGVASGAAGGNTIAQPLSGVYRADRGIMIGGTAGQPGMRCAFYRTHQLYDSDGQESGTFTAVYNWTLGGGGGAV